MGASFRNIDEITELAGCDLLTISPKLLDQLRSSDAALTRKLDADNPAGGEAQIHVDAESFQTMMAADRMATDKLSEGIKGFSKAIETLESMLAHRLAELEGGQAFGHAVQEIFLLNDMNGMDPSRGMNGWAVTPSSTHWTLTTMDFCHRRTCAEVLVLHSH